MQIRRATDADRRVMEELWEASNAEATYKPYPDGAFAPSLLTNHIALVAEQDGVAVATAYVNATEPHFGFVFGVYVVPDARRQGIARALIEEIARILHEGGRRFILLNVDTPNRSAREAYEKLGFEDAARTLRVEVEKLLG